MMHNATQIIYINMGQWNKMEYIEIWIKILEDGGNNLYFQLQH